VTPGSNSMQWRRRIVVDNVTTYIVTFLRRPLLTLTRVALPYRANTMFKASAKIS
jgi:hypothetical protein